MVSMMLEVVVAVTGFDIAYLFDGEAVESMLVKTLQTNDVQW